MNTELPPSLSTFVENGSMEVKIIYDDLPVLASLTAEPFKDNEAIGQTQNSCVLMSLNSSYIHESS